MALIGKIRKNSWLLVVVIGLALAAFVIMDMTGQGGPSAGSLTLVEVDGEKVDWVEFQNAERILYTGATVDVFDRRNYLYNYFVDRTIVGSEASANGLAVPVPELVDLQFGTRLSPIIQSRFADPTTGQVNREYLNSVKQSIEAGQLPIELRDLWAYQEKEIVNERLEEKLANLIRQGFYTPSWLVENSNLDQTVRSDFAFVNVPYDEIANDEVDISNSDLREYISAHKSEFENLNETRSINFVSFNVTPTPQDSVKLKEEISNLIEEFKITDNDTLFIENNYGTLDFAYLKKDQVSPVIADSVFNLPIGTVFGPYIDQNAYQAVKIRDRMPIPDSVRVRHIIRTARNLQEYTAAQQLLDSLKNLIETGVQRFDSLAVDFSQGALNVTLNGGDLGYNALGAFVKPFNDLVFFEAELGKLYIVATQFGIHLVEVTDKKYISNEEGVQLAFLNSPIIPSEETQNNLYDEVLDFTGTNRTVEAFKSSVNSRSDVNLQTSNPFRENDFFINLLGGGQTTRDIIRWAFDLSTEIEDVSPEVYIYQDEALYFNNKYVVVSLLEITPKGMPELESVRPQVEGIVRNQKKAKLLIERLSDKSDLQSVAEEYGSEVDTARGVTFLTDFISGLGEEPAVAAASGLCELNQISEPIEGISGVFLIKPFSRTEASSPNLVTLRQTITNQKRQQTLLEMIRTLRSNANIKDYRYKYY